MDEFNRYDKIIIVAPASEIACLDGYVGIYLRKANDNESYVRIDIEEYGIHEVITVKNKYIKLYDKWINRRKGEEITNEKQAETISEENHEKDCVENFIPELQEILGIKDNVKFYLNNDLSCKCYFENGKLFLSEKNSDKVIKDDNLRNKVFYGLATGTIKPIVGRLTTVPKDGFKYYYWQTVPDANREKEKIYHSIVGDLWAGTIEDYMRFYVGNSFPTREACLENSNVIERIKNRALKTGI